MKIEMIVERTKTGYSAYSAKHPVFTVGKTLQELKTNMLEALNLHFEAKGKIFTRVEHRDLSTGGALLPHSYLPGRYFWLKQKKEPGLQF